MTLKVAVQDSWPNLTVSAEREFVARFVLAAEKLGWQTKIIVTSDDIIEFHPDVVLITHEFTPKLTPFLTLGVIWSPISFFRNDPIRIRNILSYDGYLVATDDLGNFIRSLLVANGKDAPISDFRFLPTALASVNHSKLPSSPAIFYAGVNWDGKRHHELFSALFGKVPLRIYGDAKKWEHVGDDYRGTIPFDGVSVVNEIGKCGIALSLHSQAHKSEAIPSMRLFEAASAGAVIISDRSKFAVDAFGDNLLYVNSEESGASLARQIIRHFEWISSNPELAAKMGQRCRKIFEHRFDLLAQLKRLPEFVETTSRSMAFCEKSHTLVEVIVRVGGRPVEIIRRALNSIVTQSHNKIALLIVRYRILVGLEELLSELEFRFEQIKIVDVPDNGFRSTALWAGLSESRAEYICNLDDDDTIHPTHIASMLQKFQTVGEECVLIYGGVVEVQEDDGHWFYQPNFRGDLTSIIKERRRLRFLEPFSREKMLQFDNFIQSNAWMARRRLLTAEILVDPKVKVAEDVLFYLLLMQVGDFTPTWRVTADWNWRTNSKDNSMLHTELWADNKNLLARLAKAGITSENINKKVDSHRHKTIKEVLRRPRIILHVLARELKKWNLSVPYLNEKVFLDFRGGIPARIQAKGLSTPETWGVSSDSNIVSIGFEHPLPKRFRLKLYFRAFGPNIGEKFVLHIGNKVHYFSCDTEEISLAKLHCRNPHGSRTILIDIPHPTYSTTLGYSDGERNRGIGLIKMEID